MNNFLSQLFYQITEELELTESQEGAITKAYNAVADWLNASESILKQYKVEIYPQGSMKLGTVVKPLKKDDYDVDMVCLLKQNSSTLSAEQVKRIVGKRLSQHASYNRMLQKEGKRCWTLQYSESLNFHMDILPAIPEANHTEAIRATHKQNNTYQFIPTNPHGYANWFRSQMQIGRKTVFRDSIEKLPEYPRKTVLQKVVQLLKRHRDVMFQDDQDNTPISIIITTLAGKLYSGEDSLVDFFEKSALSLCEKIENRSGVYWVENPVDKKENFADKWAKEPQKQKAFFSWTAALKKDVQQLKQCTTSAELQRCLYKMFGQSIIDKTCDSMGGFNAIVPQSLKENTAIIPLEIKSALAVSHRQKPKWQVPSWKTVKIEAIAHRNGYSFPITSGIPLEKGLGLTFRARHATLKPYTVEWQITNTGFEAKQNDCLRGGFYESEPSDINSHTESTLYSGIHYVQCFIIKKGRCVAKSDVFIVRIK